MAKLSATPVAIRRACELIIESGLCRIVRAVESIDDALSWLIIAIDLPYPNAEGLPATVELECFITHPYPFGDIELISKGEDIRGFPHQATDGGKLCLPPAHDAPWNEYRLLKYVEWTKQWLADAAQGQLLKRGDPYELPDFRHTKIPDATLQQIPPILFGESAASLPLWQARVGQSGEVGLASCKVANAIAAVDWFDADNSMIHRVPFSTAFLGGADRFTGHWVLLPKLTIVRTRPPHTYEELARLFHSSGVSLEKVLRLTWALGRSSGRFGVLLLGCPIPDTVGGAPIEVHWQPLLLPNREATRQQYKGRGRRDEGLLWHIARKTVFGPSKRVTYGQSVNVAVERQYARGAAPSFSTRQAIALIGAGAIGSLVAEALTRAGVSPLSIFDNERLEFGNLCRHTLEGAHVGRNKAQALAARLSSANPLSVIEAYPQGIPLHGSASGAPSIALASASTLIDCSADHGAFLWMSTYARRNKKRLASLFINRGATLLTLVLSGRNVKAEKVLDRLNQVIVSEATPVDVREYLGTEDGATPLIPGPGCWNPTFPGRNNHIALLVAAAVDYLYEWLSDTYQCDGRAVVLRRRDTSPIIELAFDGKFR